MDAVALAVALWLVVAGGAAIMPVAMSSSCVKYLSSSGLEQLLTGAAGGSGGLVVFQAQEGGVHQESQHEQQ
jgi:hypothetical protein